MNWQCPPAIALTNLATTSSICKVSLTLGIVLYLVLVRILRYRRARSIPKRYGLTTRLSYAGMTTDDAQAILKDLMELEFPKIFGFSIIFALLREGDCCLARVDPAH